MAQTTRRKYIELIRRLVYGGQPNDDATLTINLCNEWLNPGIGIAAQKNYVDNAKLEGIACVNDGFYVTFKSLSISQDEQFLWKLTLPHIPFGLGDNEGISTVVIKDADSGQISLPVVLMNQSQRSISGAMRPIPSKILGYNQGEFLYLISTILLHQFTATVTLVSGGASTNLDSTLNVPDDYLPVVTEYMKQQLMFERSVPVDVQNDGVDAIKTT